MPTIKIQGENEIKKGIYYEVDYNATCIGEGGMGKVVCGIQVDEKTGATRDVAIKFIYDDSAPKIIEKARREASIQISSDNLLEMLGFIETEDDSVLGEKIKHYHVVSELLRGVSLRNVMKGITEDFEGKEVLYAKEMYKFYKSNPSEFASEVIKKVLMGVMALHEAGYIHRDIDPTNIMLTVDRKIKLIDFGIAKHIGPVTNSDFSTTIPGTIIGKPEYAAPELVLGDIKSQDVRTDIYAMGILLFECIVGHPPFRGDYADIIQKQTKKSLPLREIKNKYLRAIIQKATQKKREKRYQNAAEMMVALKQNAAELKKSNKDSSLSLTVLSFVGCIIAGVATGVIFALFL